MVPPPLNGEYAGMQENIINEELPRMIREIAFAIGLPKEHVIDHFDSMGGLKKKRASTHFVDNCHPNDQGYIQMTYNIYKNMFHELR